MNKRCCFTVVYGVARMLRMKHICNEIYFLKIKLVSLRNRKNDVLYFNADGVSGEDIV